MNQKRFMKRTTTLLAGLVIVLTMLFALSLTAFADSKAADNRLGNIGDDTFQTLGFDTDQAKKEADNLAKKSEEMSTAPFPLATFHELFVGNSSSGSWTNLPKRTGEEGIYAPLEGTNIWNNSWNLGVPNGTAIAPQAVKSVAFDPYASGKDNYIAQVIVGPDSRYKNGSGVYLRVSDGTNKAQTDIYYLGLLLFRPDNFYMGSLLAIAAGDYDGDGKDEIAVYAPNSMYTSGFMSTLPCIQIFELSEKDKGKLNMVEIKELRAITGKGRVALPQDAYEYPTVSLATIEALGTAADSLAVTAGMPRNANKSDDYNYLDSSGASTLGIWQRPLVDNSTIQYEFLTNKWDNKNLGYQAEGKYKEYRETMLYPGVAAGDIDGDGDVEIVVAGYRAANNKGGGWDLDKDRMLITYFDYDSATGKCTQATAMQWIGMKESDYGKAASLGFGVKDYDIVDPPTVRVFSERGANYNNSVFVDGVVLSLPTMSLKVPDPNLAQLVQKEQTRGLWGGADKNPDQNNLVAQFDLDKTFRICYAAPLRALDTLSEYNPGTKSLGRRTVMDAVVGNFDGNGLTREQVVFTYGAQTTTGSNYRSSVAMLGFTADKADGTAEVGNKTVDKFSSSNYKDNIKGVSFSAKYLGENICATVAAPDVNDDSIIRRYNPNKAPAYYFSDPQITAVLQAAPYFAELKDEMDAQPSTAFSKITGTEGEASVGISAHGQIGAGVDISLDAGPVVVDMEVFSFEAMFSITADYSNTLGATYSSEFTKTFETSYDDAVVLSMTPYVRYYYEQYNPTKKVWEEVYDDVPGTPQLTRLTVDAYDEVAEMQGWDSLREVALDGATAGDPSSYSETAPPGMRWVAASTSLAPETGGFIPVPESHFETAGYGSGTTGLSITDTAGVSAGVEAGIGLEAEVKAKFAVVAVGVSTSSSVTAGYTRSTFAGTQFDGVTPDIPSKYRTDYGFKWAFGTRLMDLSKSGDESLTGLVLTYLVKDVKALPKAPEDLQVEETGLNSVTISWSKPKGVAAFSYEVGRKVGDSYFPIGTVTPDQNAPNARLFFTDTNCEPGEEYEYVVRTNSYLDNVPRSSAYSQPVLASTLLEGGATISQQPQDVSVRVGENASFSVGLTNAGGITTYQWQQRQGNDTWKNAEGLQATSPTLGLYNVRQDMNGMQYRCMVRVLAGSRVQTIYSKAATLSVGQGATTTVLQLDKDSGKAEERVPNAGKEDITIQIGVTAVYGDQTYDVMAQNVSESEEAYHTDYYLQKDGQYYYSAAVTAAAVAEAPKNENENNYQIQLSDEPQPIAMSQNFYPTSDFEAENGTPAKALTGQPEYQTWALPVAVSTDEYTGYNNGTHTVYQVNLSDTTLYYYKIGDNIYQQLLLQENDGKLSFVATGSNQLPENVTPEILNTEYEIASASKPSIDFATELTLENCAYYPGKTGGEAADQYLAVVAADFQGETHYYTVGEENALTRVYLGNAYHYGEDVLLQDFQPVALYGVQRDFATQQAVLGEKLNDGDTVTLTVTVTSGDGGAVEEGFVIFQMVNTSGNYVESRQVPVANDGTAKLEWVAPLSGVYEISAAYNGSAQWTPSKTETPEVYTAYQSQGWLALGGATEMEYGSSLELTPLYYPADAETVGEKVTPGYQVKLNGQTVENLIQGNRFTPTAAGTYVITATHNDEAQGKEHTVTKTVMVTKKAITVKALPIVVTKDGWPDGILDNGKLVTSEKTLEIQGVLDGDLDYELFTLLVANAGVTDLNQLTTGLYNIRVTVDSNDEAYQKFAAKYSFVATGAEITFQPNDVNISYSAGENGLLQAWLGGVTVPTNSTVTKNMEVSFTANPNTGYVVDKWTVTVGDKTLEETYEGKQNISVTASGNIHVQVSFKEQTYQVKYTAETANGKLTAYYNDDQGQVIAEGGTSVAAGSKICFVAEPAAGRALKSWTVNGVTVNVNGVTYKETAYTIDKLDKNITVEAVYDDNRSFRTAVSAIDADGNPAGLLGTVTPNGEAMQNSGANFTITAKPASDCQILEWRSYQTDGSYAVLQGNLATYDVKNLQQDLDIRVVFAPGQTTYLVSFGTDMEKGVVTATSGTTEVTNNSRLAAGIPLTFQAVPSDGYDTAYWVVNGQVRQNTSANTLTLKALDADLNVQAVLLAKPTITFAQPEHGGMNVKVKAGSGWQTVESGNQVAYGSQLQVTLTPDTEYEAQSFTINGTEALPGALYADESGATTDDRVYTFTLGQRQDYDLTAAFDLIQPAPTVSFSVGGGEGAISAAYSRKGIGAYEKTSGAIELTEAYRDGAILFNAQPDGGFWVKEWRLNGQKIETKAATFLLPITGEMTGEQQVEVIFEAIDNSIIYEVLGNTGGSLEAWLDELPFSSGSVLSLDGDIRFVATPDADSQVEYWLVNGSVYQGTDGPLTENELIFEGVANTGAQIMVKFDQQVTVDFTAEHGTVTAAANGKTLASGDEVPLGSIVTYQAFPDPGYVFDGWDGDGQGNVNPLTLTADQALSVSAQFVPAANCTITFANPANGMLTATKGGVLFESGDKAQPGEEIVFQTAANQDYVVSGWSVNGIPAQAEGDSYTLTVTGDHDVAAIVSPSGYTLSYEATANGTISAATATGHVENGGTVAAGSKVTLTAQPNENYMVEGWYLDGSDTAVVGSKGKNTYTLETLLRNTAIKVNFMEKIAPTLTIQTSGSGDGTVTATVNGENATIETGGKLTVNYGDMVVLTATPANSYNLFSGWSENATPLASTATLNLGAVTADKTITATFAVKTQINLTVAWDSAAGNVSAQAGYDSLAALDLKNNERLTVNPGQKLVLTAVPQNEGQMVRWTVNGEKDPVLKNVLTIDPLNVTTKIAVEFVEQPADVIPITITDPAHGSITVEANGTALKSGDLVTVGTELSLKATADSGYSFNKWAGSLTGNKATMTYTIPLDATALVVSADFTKNGGGTSGGGGGGGGSTTTTPKDDSKDTTVVDETQGKELVENAKQNGGDITIKTSGNRVELPASFLSEAAGQTKADILVSTSVATIRLPNGGLMDLAAPGGSVKVEVILKKTDNNSNVLTLNVIADNKTVTNVEGGVRVTVPYAQGKETTVALLQKADGSQQILPKAVVIDGKMLVPFAGSGSVILTDAPQSFGDIANHWGIESINFVAARQLFQGVAEGKFEPNGNMSRSMAAMVLYRLESSPAVSVELHYNDVQPDVWYAAAVAWSTEQDILKGSGVSFAPNQNISREQLAAMLYRYTVAMGLETKNTGDISKFKDADNVSSWAIDAMAWAVANKIVNGREDETLDPSGNASRAEVSSMLQRYIGLTAKHTMD